MTTLCQEFDAQLYLYRASREWSRLPTVNSRLAAPITLAELVASKITS